MAIVNTNANRKSNQSAKIQTTFTVYFQSAALCFWPSTLIALYVFTLHVNGIYISAALYLFLPVSLMSAFAASLCQL